MYMVCIVLLECKTGCAVKLWKEIIVKNVNVYVTVQILIRLGKGAKGTCVLVSVAAMMHLFCAAVVIRGRPVSRRRLEYGEFLGAK